MKSGLALLLLLFVSLYVTAQNGIGNIDTIKQPFKIRHHIIYTNIADLILQKWNLGYEYVPTNNRWRLRIPAFVDVKNQNYGIAVGGFSTYKVSKHVEHIVGGQLLAEWIDSFYEDLYLKYRPRGLSVAPRFATGLVFTAKNRFVFGIEGDVGPGFVFRDQRFKGTYLSVGLGIHAGVKF